MLKPDFFKHEGLAELGPWHRLLYQGLWCLADREGRLEDRPKRIKAEVFPYDNAEVETWLRELAIAGFIVQYEAKGVRCIWIPSFLKHQKPHVREAPSEIPPPPGSPPSTTPPGEGTAKHDLGSAQAQPRQCSADLDERDEESPGESSASREARPRQCSGTAKAMSSRAVFESDPDPESDPASAVPADPAAREQSSSPVPASAGRQGVTTPPTQQQAQASEPKAIPRRPSDAPLDLAGEAHVGELLAEAGFRDNESNRRALREAVRRRGWALVDTAFAERDKSDFYSGRSGECQRAGNVGWLTADKQLDALARQREEREQADAFARPQPPRFTPPPPPIRTPEGDAAAAVARAKIHALFAETPPLETSPPESDSTSAPATRSHSPAA